MPRASKETKAAGSELLEAARSAGFPVVEIIFDQKKHRFAMHEGDRRRSGQYQAFRTGKGYELELTNYKDFTMNKRFRSWALESLTPEEIQAHDEEIERARIAGERRSQNHQATIALATEKRWQAAKEGIHPRINRRFLHFSFGTRIEPSAIHSEGVLLVPCRDIDRKLWSVQYHVRDDKGMFLYGARQKGLFHLMGEIRLDAPLFICEGFFTSATVRELSGHTVACAFSANNIPEVAAAFRQRYPALEIVISGDNDEAGQRASQKTARAVRNIRVLFPKFPFLHPDYKDWNDFLKPELGRKGRIMAVEQLKNHRKESTAGDFETFFKDWLEANQIRTNYRGQLFYQGNLQENAYVEDHLFLAAHAASPKFGLKNCQSALNIWITDRKIEFQAEIFERILPYEPSDELKKFVSAIALDPKPAVIAVFEHWMQQIKRKILGLPIYDHMMPVLIGPKRSGKSTALKNLLNVVPEIVGNKTLQSICDETQWPMFGYTYIVFLDEMSKAKYADNETLKQVLSGDELQTRRFHKQTQLFIPNRATFLGTSNEPLENIIKDSGGNRRLYQVLSKSRCDWEAINAIDNQKAWRSVDPYAPCPIHPFMEEIQSDQETTRFKTDVEYWATDASLHPSTEYVVLLKELYSFYEPASRTMGYDPKDLQRFASELRKLNFNVSHTRDGAIVFATINLSAVKHRMPPSINE